MGVVWRAVHRTERVPVAVKIMRSIDSELTAAFRAEVRAVGALRHPNIVWVFDFGELATDLPQHGLAAGSQWLAMELANDTLKDQPHPMAWPEARGVLEALLEALAHAHSRGVLHRDLKPANILLGGARAGPRLADFGIAMLMDEVGEGTTHRTASSGTPAFMAPEQVMGNWRDFGPWTDLYGLGCVAYLLVTGRRPFKNLRDRWSRFHLDELPIELAVAAPDGIVEWIRGLTRREPTQRFQSAADALHALKRIDDTAAAPPDPGEHPRTAPPIPSDWRRTKDLDSAGGISGVGLGLYAHRAIDLVGRTAARDHLWSALQAARTKERPSVVCISGPAGSGKTRLASWLSHRSQEVGAAEVFWAVHGAGAGPREGLPPLVRRKMRCQGLSPKQTAKHIRSRLPVGSDDVDVALIRELIHPGVESDKLPPVRFSGPAERYSAMARFLSLLCPPPTDRVALLVLDDVQWGADALGLAEHLLKFGAQRLLIVLTVEPEVLASRPVEAWSHQAVLAHDRASVVSLEPLVPAEQRRLVDGLLPLEPALARRVCARTNGNPLFAIQMLGEWVQEGRLLPTNAGFRLQGKGRLHESPRAVLAARLAHVLQDRPEQDLVAMEIGAALGREVGNEEWRLACARESVVPTATLLEACVDAGLVEVVPRCQEWGFRQDILRRHLEEGAESAGRRQRHHAACAAALKEAWPDLCARIGQHLLQSGQYLEAVGALTDAVERHLGAEEWAEGAALLADREEAMDRLGLAESDATRVEGWFFRAKVAKNRGEFEVAEELLRDADGVLSARAPCALHVRALKELAAVYGTRGRLDECVAIGQRALSMARSLGDELWVAHLEQELACAWLGGGDLDRARPMFLHSIEAFDRLGLQTQMEHSRWCLAVVELSAGRLAEAAALLHEARVGLSRLGGRYQLSQVHNALGDVERQLGNLGQASSHYEQSEALARAIGSGYWLYPHLNIGFLQIATRDYERAQDTLMACVAAAEARDTHLVATAAHAGLWVCSAKRGDWVQWDLHGTRVRELVASTGFVECDVASASQQAADIAARAGHNDRARLAYGVAMQQWQQLGRAEKLAQVRERLGALDDS